MNHPAVYGKLEALTEEEGGIWEDKRGENRKEKKGEDEGEKRG